MDSGEGEILTQHRKAVATVKYILKLDIGKIQLGLHWTAVLLLFVSKSGILVVETKNI